MKFGFQIDCEQARLVNKGCLGQDFLEKVGPQMRNSCRHKMWRKSCFTSSSVIAQAGLLQGDEALVISTKLVFLEVYDGSTAADHRPDSAAGGVTYLATQPQLGLRT